MGMPFRIIPKAMQRKANRRPRWVSGHISPYPTVEMLTYRQTNTHLISWEEIHRQICSLIRDNVKVSCFVACTESLKYSVLLFFVCVCVLSILCKTPPIKKEKKKNLSHEVSRHNGLTPLRRIFRFLPCRGNSQTISTRVSPEGEFAWL